MKRVALLVLFMVFSAALVAQDSMAFDGNIWKQLSYDGKILFLMAMGQGEWIAQKRVSDLGEAILLDLLITKMTDERPIDVVIKGIDSFYIDNPKMITLPVALVYVMLLDASKVE